MSQLNVKLKTKLLKQIIPYVYTLVFTIYSFTSIFFPIESIIPGYSLFPQWKKMILVIVLGLIPLLLGFMAWSIAILFFSLKRKRKYKLDNNGNTSFVVEYGDLHKLMFPKRTPKKEYTVIIPVHNQLNRIFEDWGSAGRSVHGNWVLEVKNNTPKYGKTLDEISQESLEYLKNKYRERFDEERNTEYEIGDGIWISGDSIGVKGVDYYFIATNKLSDDNHSYYEGVSKELSYVKAIQGIIDAYQLELNQQIVYMPIIGGGFGDINKPQTNLLSFIYEMFKFNGERIKSDIHVVIFEDNKHAPKASIFIE